MQPGASLRKQWCRLRVIHAQLGGMFDMVSVAYPADQPATTKPVERLDGWKSIAAYLKRDRTTVIRWARERGLPVHRLPGGQTGTVYALKHELDRWVGLPNTLDEIAPEPAPPLEAVADAPGRNQWHIRPRVWAIGAAISGLAIAIPAVVAKQQPRLAPQSTPAASALVLPQDPETAASFLTARDLVAGRKSADLESAISLLEDVVRTAPDYALGHATLAEALVLSREFGTRGNDEAYAGARIAARSAVRLAPEMAAGHRMLGFLAYWADQDFKSADAHFRRALSLDPADAQSHFWYGNILSDSGRHAAGLRSLNQARLLQPGSAPIATDLAWAQWAAGQDAAAKSALQKIIADDPDFAVAYDCLSIIALSEGDYAGYARNFLQFATLKQDARLIANARAVNAAFSRSTAAARDEIMRQAIDDAAQGRTRSHAWPALAASVQGDRQQMKGILQEAEIRGERWSEAGVRLRIERAWKDDPEISALVARRSSADTAKS